jgi:hypothetical protein
MGFWERTWKERSEAVNVAFGETDPMGMVVSFSWRDRIRLPGACALQFPPVEARRDPERHRRDDWLYLSLGLSQPLDKAEMEAVRAAGRSSSARGIELGFLTEKKSAWPPDALYYFLTHITDGEHIAWGDRFPMGFRRRDDGTLDPLVGNTTGFELTGEIRAVLFWPYLFPDGQLVTSTGKFMVVIATGLTGDEWQAAKSTTTAHLLLLLHRAGIGQRTLPERQCLFQEERWRKEWAQIAKLSAQDCEAEFEQGIAYLERTRAKR